MRLRLARSRRQCQVKKMDMDGWGPVQLRGSPARARTLPRALKVLRTGLRHCQCVKPRQGHGSQPAATPQKHNPPSSRNRNRCWALKRSRARAFCCFQGSSSSRRTLHTECMDAAPPPPPRFRSCSGCFDVAISRAPRPVAGPAQVRLFLW
jgi:hypothetical protein